MELTITNGRGYVGADKADKEGNAIDEIAVDAIYTPVERVNSKGGEYPCGSDHRL